MLKQYSYDDNGRTVAMSVKSQDDATLETFGYEYDRNSQIIEETHANNLPEESKRINETTSYTYDNFGRLTQSAKTDHQNGDTQTVISYGYDDVGNRISMTENGVENTYTYNSLNQLMSSAENGEDTTYSYDGRGNQITETKGNTITESTYSVRGEMVSLTKKSGDTVLVSQENTYNHDGIRIAKKEDGTTRRYYYDNGVIAYTKDGTTLSSANVTGPEGQIIGTFRGEDYRVYLKDIQNSTTSIVKEDGSLSAAYEYSDFGETEEITGSSFDNEICYTGAIYDATTGLYYMNTRYYDASNGRFISQDTYRGELKNPAQWHLYAYCANNPINYTDPSGHWVASIAIKAEAAAFIGGYCMLGFNRDLTHTSITWSEGLKFTTNIGASVSIIGSHSNSKKLKDILKGNWSFGTSYSIGNVISASGSVSISKGGGVNYSAGISAGKWVFPVSVDFEWGRTTERYKWKLAKVANYSKTYNVKGYRFNRKNMGSYVRYRVNKGRVQINMYKSGKTTIKRY